MSDTCPTGKRADDLHTENSFFLRLAKSDPVARARMRELLPKVSDADFERIMDGKYSSEELPTLLGLTPKIETTP